MKEKEKNLLEKEAEEFFGSEVRVLQKNVRGIKEEAVYIFKNFGGIGVEIGRSESNDKMFYHLTAILQERDKTQEIDVIPLREVLKAIKNSEVIDYHRLK